MTGRRQAAAEHHLPRQSGCHFFSMLHRRTQSEVSKSRKDKEKGKEKRNWLSICHFLTSSTLFSQYCLTAPSSSSSEEAECLPQSRLTHITVSAVHTHSLCILIHSRVKKKVLTDMTWLGWLSFCYITLLKWIFTSLRPDWLTELKVFLWFFGILAKDFCTGGGTGHHSSSSTSSCHDT